MPKKRKSFAEFLKEKNIEVPPELSKRRRPIVSARGAPEEDLEKANLVNLILGQRGLSRGGKRRQEETSIDKTTKAELAGLSGGDVRPGIGFTTEELGGIHQEIRPGADGFNQRVFTMPDGREISINNSEFISATRGSGENVSAETWNKIREIQSFRETRRTQKPIAEAVEGLGGLEDIGKTRDLTSEEKGFIEEKFGFTSRELKNMGPNAIKLIIGLIAAAAGGTGGTIAGAQIGSSGAIGLFDDYTHQSDVSAGVARAERMTADQEIEMMIRQAKLGGASDPQTATEFIETYNLYWSAIFREWRAMKAIQISATGAWDERAIREMSRLNGIVIGKVNKDREFFDAMVQGKIRPTGIAAPLLEPVPAGTTPETLPPRQI